MRQAKERINSSFFGLLLLLSSFLVLNIINPELTTLRMPEDIEDIDVSLKPLDVGQPGISNPCESIIVYSKTNFEGDSNTILMGPLPSGDLTRAWPTGIGGPALSIKVNGFCKVELWSSKNCWWKENLMATIYTSLSDIDSVYLNDPVVCVKNLAGAASSSCDTDCFGCSKETDCITSGSNCVWQNFLCVESTCNTNCSECTNDIDCVLSQSEYFCMWNYGSGTCEQSLFD